MRNFDVSQSSGDWIMKASSHAVIAKVAAEGFTSRRWHPPRDFEGRHTAVHAIMLGETATPFRCPCSGTIVGLQNRDRFVSAPEKA